MNIRDRIIEFRRVKAKELLPNPANWRQHPQAQADALRGILSEVGYVDALLARQTPGGLMLLDGHLRAETTPDMDVPVLIVDLDDAEAAKVLATFDPIAEMATANPAQLDELLRDVQTSSESLSQMLADLSEKHGLYETDDDEDASEEAIPEQYQILIECESEAEQAKLLGQLTKKGVKCRSLIS